MVFNDKKYLPPIFTIHVCFISFLVGLFSIFYFKQSLISIIILIAICKNKKYTTIIFMVICYIIGSATILIIDQKNKLKYKIPKTKYVYLEAKIKNIKTYPLNKTYVILHDVIIFNENHQYRLKSNVLWKIYNLQFTPLPGQKVYGKFRIKPLRYLQNPGVFDYTKIYYLKNIHFVAYASKDINEIFIYGKPTPIWSIRQKIKKNLTNLLKSTQYQGILLSLIVGDRHYITYEQMEKLQDASLSHIIAQSGLHVGFVALMGYTITYIIGLLYPQLFLKIPKQKIGCITASIFVIIYLCISEPRISIIRASIMFFSFAILFYFNYNYATIDGIFISLFLILLHDPTSVFDIGLQLSYLSVLGIIIFYPIIKSHLKSKINNKILLYLCTLFIITFIIQIVLLPVILYYFGEIPLNFLLNLMFIPIVGFVIVPLLFLALLLILMNLHCLSLILVNINDKLITYSFNLISFLKKIHLINSIPFLRPNSYMIIGYYMLLFSILLIYYNKKIKAYLICIIALCLIFIPLFLNKLDNNLKISILDVGHGQSILLSYKKKRILIDGGGSYYRYFNFGRTLLSPILTYMHFPSLDKVILTHGDIDHIGGLFYLAKKYNINQFYYNGIKTKYNVKSLLTILKKRKIPVKTIKKGDKIIIDKDLKIYVLNPPKNSYDNENDNSLVLKVSYKNHTILLITSDVGKRVLNQIIQKKMSPLIFMVPHHGSRKSFSFNYLQKIDSKIWVVSTGFLNRFRLPSKLWIKFARQNNILLLNTAYQGCITFKIKDKKLVIITQGGLDHEKHTSKIHYLSTSK